MNEINFEEAIAGLEALRSAEDVAKIRDITVEQVKG